MVINGAKYLMNFIHDYTRMCWGYLLKHKYEVFETFKKIHLWIENEAQYHIGTLHIDNVKLCSCNELQNYLFQHGIMN